MSWGEHNPHKTGFLWVRLELTAHRDPHESCFPMGLHLCKVPLLPCHIFHLHQSAPVSLWPCAVSGAGHGVR